MTTDKKKLGWYNDTLLVNVSKSYVIIAFGWKSIPKIRCRDNDS